MRAQAADNVIFMPLFQLFLDLFQRKMHDVVVVQLEGRDQIAETQPQPVKEIDFICSEVRGMGTEDFVELVPVGHVNFKVELWLRIAKFFPGLTDKPGVFFCALSRRASNNNSAGLQ